MNTAGKNAIYAAAAGFGLNRYLHARAKRQVLVLCYHGVVSHRPPAAPYEFRNAVSIAEFQVQLEHLTRSFHPVSATDVLLWMKGRMSLPDWPVLVTLDDGYRNNYEHAAPLLKRYGVPALIAISTGYMGTPRLLWPDAVMLRILRWRERWFPLPDASPFAMPEDYPARVALSRKILQWCKAVPVVERDRYLEQIGAGAAKADTEEEHELFDFMGWDEVRSLARAGIEFASHTVAHPILTRLAPQAVAEELRQSKRAIEDELGSECHSVVYPNGTPDAFSPEVADAARQSGYSLGFTLIGGLVDRTSYPFTLPRLMISAAFSRLQFAATVSTSDMTLRRPAARVLGVFARSSHDGAN
jgi:peptidoglycan/xylan/chitin deacetylase (PgdA/CDA1 family)